MDTLSGLAQQSTIDSGHGYRIGVDIGGTFTDLVLLAGDGSVSTRKLPTSPDHHGRVVVDGLASLLAELRLTPRIGSARSSTAPPSPPTRSSRAKARGPGC